MDQHAFSADSTFPPLKKNLPRLYSMRFCPYAHRIRLVLNFYKIRHEIVNINTKNKPQWFLLRNPVGTVPTIEIVEGKLIFESLIICEFLDQVYGNDLLFGKQPYCRALMKMFIERFSKLSAAYSDILSAKNEEEKSKNVTKFKNTIQLMENTLKSDYFGGKVICIIDLFYWPWFERFPTIKELVPELYPLVPEDLYPKLNAWMKRMWAQPVVKKCSVPFDYLLAYGKSSIKDEIPDYDIGL